MQPYVTSDTLGSKTTSWLESILPFNQYVMKLNVAASALLVVDMQNFFLDSASLTFTCGGVAILPPVKLLMDVFRQAKRVIGAEAARLLFHLLEGQPEDQSQTDIRTLKGSLLARLSSAALAER